VEIADNALICYRCGHATTEPRIKPPDTRRRRPGGGFHPSLVALIVLLIAAIFLAIVARDETPRILSGIIAVLAVILLAVRIVQLRR
jgi:hypothetical protein